MQTAALYFKGYLVYVFVLTLKLENMLMNILSKINLYNL